MKNYSTLLPSLYALEHFGLGRYGDLIEPKGFEQGFANMATLLKENGMFYLSVPIGIERVEFNANYVFDPRVIVNLAVENSLRLSALKVIRQGDRIDELAPDEVQLSNLASQRYTLGIFTFVKSTKV